MAEMQPVATDHINLQPHSAPPPPLQQTQHQPHFASAHSSPQAHEQTQPPSFPHPSSAHPGGGAPSSQTPGHPSFRRQRASRACETCHARKVRCDAASLGVPCTNCVAFSIECRIPTPKRKKGQSKKDEEESDNAPLPPTNPLESIPPEAVAGSTITPQGDVSYLRGAAYGHDQAMLGIKQTSDSYPQQRDEQDPNSHSRVMKPKFVRAPIKEAGRVAYLGESSNLSLLVHDRHGTTDVVHYPLPENIRGARAKVNELDNVEMDILHTRGAFLLPPRTLCDELVDAYFMWVAPVVPAVNRSRFMRRYRDSKNPPSLLLLQAILLAGSRVCKNPQLMDSNGSTTPAAMTFYKRAKALFDANYEDDRVTIVQAAILMGWYWEGPEDVTRNVFFWSRVACIVAQGSGMHRSVETSQLTRADKRLWKRVWWTLFTRDRSVAVALGRPCGISTDDSDVEMLTEDDFVEDEVDKPAKYPPNLIHVQFFLNYVKLTEIMGLVLSQQYSVANRSSKHNALDLTHSDMALADWLQNCPREVYWERPKHHFWSALLHANYYTTLCLLHRAHMPPAGTPATTLQNGQIVETAYPSRNIAYQAAGMITSIVESLQTHDELRFAPAFIVYSLFSALIMHVYQMRSSNSAIVSATEQRMNTCMKALKEVSRVWLVAKMVHTLFESILGNKSLEERLQKAAGRKHVRAKNSQHRPSLQHSRSSQQEAPKRKFEEVDMTYPNGAPSAPMSYERSRSQTPSMTPSKELPQSQQIMPAITNPQQNSSPDLPRHDTFMGASRNATRQTTPFNAYPPTPPDLYLVTRNSPTISQDLFNNFQPDQLFPAETNLGIPNFSPTQQPNAYIDPQLGPASAPPLNTTMQPPTPGSAVTVHGSLQQPRTPSQAQPGQQGGFPPMTHRGPLQSPQLSHQAVNGMQHQPAPQQQHPQQLNSIQPSAQDPNTWAQQLHSMNGAPGIGHHQPQMQDDNWSNSSMSQAPTVPTALNVEDWFQFFGINGAPPGAGGEGMSVAFGS